MADGELITAFQLQGAELFDPITPSDFDTATQKLPVSLDGFFERFYRSFGGFSCPDRHHVTLWSIKKIVAEKHLWRDKNGVNYFPAGDLLIESDIIMLCLSDASKRPFLLFEDHEFVSSGEALIAQIAAGAFELNGSDRA